MILGRGLVSCYQSRPPGPSRNYGCHVSNIDLITYSKGGPIEYVDEAGIVQVAELNPELELDTDRYFRGFDQDYSEYVVAASMHAAAGFAERLFRTRSTMQIQAGLIGGTRAA